jgi:glycosyltransferase involved in cell wall biosynthesis
MNILIFPSWYVTPDNPISGIFFREQAQALHQSGINVYVLVLRCHSIRNIISYINTKKRYFYNDNGAKTYNVNYLNFFPKLKKAPLFYAAFVLKKAIKKIAKDNNIQFDLVHIHSAIDAGIIYLLSGQKTKYIITEHTTLYAEKRILPFKEKYLAKVFSSAGCIIAVSNGLKKDIEKYTTKNIDVIFNIISMDTHSPKMEANKNKFRFFSLGLSVNQKGFDILVSAFSKTSIKKYCELYIAGLNSQEMRNLNYYIDSEKICENIKLFGILSREEVAHYMYNCDCFVLPSRFETFGVVFAEAMYFGKPVIASKTGGPDSYVTPETGIVVPVEDAVETTKALEYMFYNRTRFVPSYIKEYAIQSFSKEKIVGQIREKYDEILSTNN